MFIRFQEKDKEVKYGYVTNEIIQVIQGDIFGSYAITDVEINLDQVTLLVPCLPTKVVGVGLNYADHAKEVGLVLPKTPALFLKSPSSVIGPNENVILPPESSKVEYEGELAVVIGKKAKNIKEENVEEYIFGYTCANDVTARDIQFSDAQWMRGKSFDTFCPIGPGIVKHLDVMNSGIEFYLNGEKKQCSNTNQLIFPIFYLISYISHQMTLYPGDIILTGTPKGTEPLKNGDIMEVKVKGIGVLENSVINS
jgi:2-keto-4-pentenoate hydratase/2-oxohepta-3-ene-1,7-dioic acid hydratase in catechol pathway